METKQYLIDEPDYMAHIDGQIKMYDLLLTMAHETRNLLLDGKFAAVLRTLNKYEHEANEVFLGWGIPDEYLCGGDVKDLRALMGRELLGVEDDGCPALERFTHPCCVFCDEAVKRAEAGEALGA